MECKSRSSDVYYLTVDGAQSGSDKVVTLAVESDRETTKDVEIADAMPLIVAQLSPSQAIRLAQVLLAAAIA